jgi:hypothetical protein
MKDRISVLSFFACIIDDITMFFIDIYFEKNHDKKGSFSRLKKSCLNLYISPVLFCRDESAFLHDQILKKLAS